MITDLVIEIKVTGLGSPIPAVRFLPRTFCNVFCVALGNATFACAVPSTCKRSFEEASTEKLKAVTFI